MRRHKLTVGLALAAVSLFALSGTAFAADTPTVDTLNKGLGDLTVSTNILWVVVSAVLVIFMQAGFALVETGFCRAKNSAHVVSTNFAIFGLGFVGYFLVGFAFMFGGVTAPVMGYHQAIGKELIGSGNWVFLWKGGFALGDIGKAGGGAVAAYFLYMVAFMDTTATIPTGGMAERWKWKAFVGWGLFCGTIYYPLFGAWTWGGGWLAKLGNSFHLGFGYVDFAGSGVVHAMGGIAALTGAIVLGPRIGKYNRDGSSNTLAAHHIPMAMLGCFILLVGWFGFNAGSTLASSDIQFAVIATNTALAAAFGATAAMFWCMYTGSKKPDPGMMVNGMLAGLVAITAPCAFVDPWAAAVIGTLAGVIVVISANFVDTRLRVDDPVGAFSVHGVCGVFGVLCVGLFGNGHYGAGWNGTTEGVAAGAKGVSGIFYGLNPGLGQLGAQAIGAAVIFVIFGLLSYSFFKLQNAIMKGGIRPPAEMEIAGMDLPEMGSLGYADFPLVDVLVGHGGTGSPTHDEPIMG